MRRRISLYIGDKLVDLDDQSFILMNYTLEDLTNPTIVKNSFTQSITLKGTPNNNKIFGDLFRSDRMTTIGSSQEGVYFDPTRKTSFTIYNEVNEILESGYVKVDKITRKRNTMEYSITLYGGLGAFFYALSYDEEGNKRTLASLKFTGEDADENELDFTITKNSVLTAWRRLNGARTSELWDIISFAPCYNGLPGGDFDANKALVKPSNCGLSVPSGYSTTNGYVLATLAREYTDIETHDLRSYLQRPVIKVSKVLDAICQSYNNGGYEVEIDPSFKSNDNPYYSKTWLTLPIINTLNAQVRGGGGSLMPKDTGASIEIPNGGNTSTTYQISFSFAPVVHTIGTPNTNLYLYTHWEETEGETYNEQHYLNYLTYTLKVYDRNDNVLETIVKRVSSANPGGSVPNIDVVGYFDQLGNWVGDNVTFESNHQGIHHVTLTRTITAKSWGSIEYEEDTTLIWKSLHSYTDYMRVTGYGLSASTDENFYKYSTSDVARSGVNISKSMLLSSDKTPCDYLLSLCKMFGLLFQFDKGTRKVTILKKSTFYNDEVIDLTNRINEDEDIPIVPFVFDSKWYDFGLETEGEFSTYYNSIYSIPYGRQRVNTGFEFNSDSKDLLDGIALTGACEVLEKSSCYVDITDGSNFIPSVFVDSGGKYSLKKSDGTMEDKDIPLPSTNATRNWWNSNHGNDFMSKIQLHNKDNSANENRDTLVFFTGMKNLTGVTTRLAVTDDNATMMSLNEGVPCWILDNQLDDANSLVQYLPVFSRYWKDNNGDITSSLDFGTPKEVAIPNINLTEDSSMYAKFWKRYISDRYDNDSRVLTCKVNLMGLQVNEALFRKFYYFDSAIWSLNKIVNHSLTTWDDTTCEFVKVQDKENYFI